MVTIDFDTLSKMRRNQENYVVIDVRSFADFDKEHITDADNIPLDEVDFIDLVEKRVVSKNGKIVLYSGSKDCPMAKKAADRLEQAGFTSIMVYTGGNSEWQQLHAKAENEAEKTKRSNEAA